MGSGEERGTGKLPPPGSLDPPFTCKASNYNPTWRHRKPGLSSILFQNNACMHSRLIPPSPAVPVWKKLIIINSEAGHCYLSFLEEESWIPPLQVSNALDTLTAKLARPLESDFCAFDADIGIDCLFSIFILVSSEPVKVKRPSFARRRNTWEPEHARKLSSNEQ